MAKPKNPAVRSFGQVVRKWRDVAGLSQTQLARAARISQSQLSSIETGSKGTSADQVRRIDDVLTAGGELVKRWHELEDQSRGFATWFLDVVSIEREASEIRIYQPLSVPGLIQTEDYAHAITRQGHPELTRSELNERVAARSDRQAVLDDPDGPMVRVVIEEYVLRRPVGGYDIMQAQLEHLAEVSRSSRLSLQIVPMTSTLHPGTDGAFHIFTVPGRGPVVYTESRRYGNASDDQGAVEDYMSVFAELRGIALPPGASRDLVCKIEEEFK
ncbi:helix-turn-helix transcriptional regulator [Streptomonospora halophila]|uniref:Helix-turn-helix transcriptional regulator n=1 Tax=Streptomonospora halophila TaxID=427369 RepID=A0ABP9GM03_9ACTN